MATLGLLAATLTPVHADNIPALSKEVAQVRDLRWKRKVAHEVVESFAATTPEATVANRRWGLPTGTSVSSAARYDSTSKKLAMLEGAPEMAIVHELAHALQDQKFDLDKLLTGATNDDARLARRALVEGDALAVMFELLFIRAGKDAPWANRAITHELDRSFPGNDPEIVLRRAGLAFVAARRATDDWSAIDAVYRKPPRSTEQILHPAKYIADEKPIAVTLAAPPSLTDYTVAHDTVWGELGFAIFLRAHGVPDEVATQAAAGWGGDRVLTLTRDTQSIGIAELHWDSEADAIEAHDAAVRAVDVTIMGWTTEHHDDRTRWLALDGTVSYVERRGTTLSIALGIPAGLAAPSGTDQASK